MKSNKNVVIIFYLWLSICWEQKNLYREEIVREKFSLRKRCKHTHMMTHIPIREQFILNTLKFKKHMEK